MSLIRVSNYSSNDFGFYRGFSTVYCSLLNTGHHKVALDFTDIQYLGDILGT